MSDVRRNKYERLLRWYPKAWREEHGRLMLDTLDEHATDRGGYTVEHRGSMVHQGPRAR